MKTDYKILWIDDEHRYVRGDKRAISTFLDEHGIVLQIIDITVTPDECPTQTASFASAVSDIDLDMVFIDFNMPEQGDKIIQHIRKDLQHYYLPILFYTSDNDAQNTLQQSIFNVNRSEGDASKVADGIYFCDRDHIGDKAKLILTSLLKKEAKPQHGRGLLMDRVSEIDSCLIEAINTFWLQVPEDKKEAVIQAVKNRVANAKNSALAVETGVEGKDYNEILQFFNDDIRRWDTNARAIVLKKILEQISNNECAQELLDFYNQGTGRPRPLLLLRNDYAHKSSADLNGDHDDERCKYIRTETRRHLTNLKKILGREA